MKKFILFLFILLELLTIISFASAYHNSFRDTIDIRYNYGNYYPRYVGFYERAYPRFLYSHNYPYFNYPNVHPYGSPYYSSI